MSSKLRWSLLAAAAVTLGCLAWRWSRPAHYANLPPTATGSWVAFGDSLTEGIGASPGNDYPSRLSQLLGVEIVNLGRSGETTESSLTRLEDVLRLRPRVVLLCLGG